MERRGNKTYYFTATLNPAEYCRDFNPGELPLGDGYVVDIFFNGITIWNPSLKVNFVKVNPFVQEAFVEHQFYCSNQGGASWLKRN